MRLQNVVLPPKSSAYHAPVYLEDTGSFSPKIDLSQPFFDGFTYKHLHHLAKELKENISAYRVMAYLFKHGADVVAMSDCAKRPMPGMAVYLERRLKSYNLLDNTQAFQSAIKRNSGRFGNASDQINISRFHHKAELLCDALASFGFLVKEGIGDYNVNHTMIHFYSQSARGRIPSKKAWGKIPEIARRAKAFNDTHPPLSIACVLLFGSLARNPDTVDDIDISIITHRNRNIIGGGRHTYATFVNMCRDYVKENGLGVQQKNIMDGPESDIQRHITGRLSRLDRVSVVNVTKENIADEHAVFYAVYLNPDLEDLCIHEHDGLINVEASSAEGKCILITP
jgi:hypothetical protein